MRARGFTLVEVLLAAAIVAVVAMIVHTLYRTVLAVRESQAGPISRSEALHAALAAVGRDLAAGMRVDEKNHPFTLEGKPGEFSALRLAAVAPPPGTADGMWATPDSVEYRVDAEAGHRLLRVTRALSGPAARGPFTTNELLRGVAAFRVEGLSGEEWKAEWKSGPETAWPAACRVSLAGREDAQTSLRMVFEIPASLSVSSSIERR